MQYKKIKMRKRSLVLALAAALLVMCLAGCRQVKVRPKDESQARVKDEKEITIMYCNEGMGSRLLQIAKEQMPEYEIDIVSVPYYEIEQKMIENDVYSDLVILENYPENTFPWRPKDYMMADLQPWLDEDEGFNADDYFPETVQAGKVGGRQLYLPIGIQNNNYIMAGEKQIEKSALSSLPEEYSLSQIYQVFMDRRYDSAVSLMSEDDYLYGTQGYHLLIETGAVDIDWDEGTIQMNEVAALDTLDFLRIVQGEWLRINVASNNKEGNFYHKLGNLPYMYDENCQGWFTYKSPSFGIGYYSSMYADKLDQSVRPFWLPRSEEAGTYTASVSLYGCIPEKAVNKEGAYEVLRYLMDMDADCWVLGENEAKTAQACFPARRETGAALMRLLMERGPEKYLGNHGSEVYPGQMVSEEQAALTEQWMDGLRRAYIQDEDMMQIAERYLKPYVLGKVVGGKDCLEEFRAEAKKYMNERLSERK